MSVSLSTGVFPKGAHSAIIRPLLKKPTLDQNTLKNYKPVANVTFVGKFDWKDCMFSPHRTHGFKQPCRHVWIILPTTVKHWINTHKSKKWYHVFAGCK